MIRFLGILAGAAIAVAALIVVVGVPEFPDEPGPQSIEVSTREQAPEPQPEVVAPPDPEPQTPDAPIEELPVPEQVAKTIEPDPQPEPEAAPEVRWYAFWSPFRSELAANGFIAQLQRTTGLDYRVVKQEIGVYEVAFAYTDDADIEEKLAQISVATGLDLPEG